MTLNEEQIKAFKTQIDNLFNDIQDLPNCWGEQDWTCCPSCGHHEMVSEQVIDPELHSYVFYHQQTTDSLREGTSVIYLQHDIKEAHKEELMAVLNQHGCEWDGSENKGIKVSFRE
jgi:hypothetical protein